MVTVSVQSFADVSLNARIQSVSFVILVCYHLPAVGLESCILLKGSDVCVHAACRHMYSFLTCHSK